MVAIEIFEEEFAAEELDDAGQFSVIAVIADQIGRALRGDRIRLFLRDPVLELDRMPVAAPAPVIFDRIVRLAGERLQQPRRPAKPARVTSRIASFMAGRAQR
jgi:hypothetical protein